MTLPNIDIPTLIVTDRLELRAPTPTDASQLKAIMDESLEDFKPWLDFAHHPYSLSSLEDLCYRARTLFINREAFIWHIWHRGSERMAGVLDLHSWDWDVPRAELGYWLRTSDTGKGIIAEAAGAVLRLAFTEWGVQRIEAHCDTRNIAAIKVAERLGFQQEGILRRYELDAFGNICDQIMLSRLAP